MNKTKTLHRITGIIIAVFVSAHLFNHAMAWFGIETHREVMEALRKIYRQPIIEILLVIGFGFQVYSGIKQVKNLKKKSFLAFNDRIQIYSGVVFAFFIVQHIPAVLFQREYFKLDTDFYFAARVVLETPFKFYFVPYYFLGMMAFGVHIAATHRKKMTESGKQKQADFQALLIVLLFLLVTGIIFYVFMGSRFPIAIPHEYHVY
jgi:succinate dehydrogenase/fumarate reductase cytochrome b subunit